MSGLYVYGIVRADHLCELAGLTVVGLSDAPPRAFGHGPVRAIVSAAPEGLRGKRRDLLAHQQVLDALVSQATTLPMRFGIVSPDEKSLTATLTTDEARLLALLADLDNRVELNVKADPLLDAVLAEIVAEDGRIRRLRSRIRDGGAYADQVRLGELVAGAVERRKQACAQAVLRRLRPIAERIQVEQPVEDGALNSAFLVDRSRVEEFSAALAEAQAEQGDGWRLRLTGPLPAYSFVGSG